MSVSSRGKTTISSRKNNSPSGSNPLNKTLYLHGPTRTTMKTNWYNSRIIKVLTHAAVWAIVLSLPYLLDTHHGMGPRRNNRFDQGFFYLNFVTSVLWIAPFYLNAYWLTPAYFNRRRYLPYIAMLVLLFAILMGIHFTFFRFVFDLPHFSLKGATWFLLPPYILVVAV